MPWRHAEDSLALALLRHGVAHHEVLKHVDQLGLVHGVVVVPVSAGVEPCVEVVDVLQLQVRVRVCVRAVVCMCVCARGCV